MAVLVEAISVVVRVSTLESKMTGGLGAFEAMVSNASLCSDGELARAGFMTPVDTERFVRKLEQLGLVHLSNERAADIVVVDQRNGPASGCSWVEFGHAFLDQGQEQRIAVCRMVESASNRIALPSGWRFEDSLSKSHTFVPTKDSDKALKFLRHENGLDVYLDLKTGKEIFVGRTGISHDDHQHDGLYGQAMELVREALDLTPPASLSFFSKWRVRRGVKLLERVVTIRPDNWAAFWVMGKARQAMRQYRESLDAFSRSLAINPEHPDAAREASISAMECSQIDDALRFAEKAVQLRADDAGLRANLALAWLFAQDPRKAKLQIEQAQAADPRDQITRAVRKIIDEVLAGTRPCPRHTSELLK